MMKKINKIVREQAALLCEVAALNVWAPKTEGYRAFVLKENYGINVSRRAVVLAGQAWHAVYIIVGEAGTGEVGRVRHAEAASLLRSGWSPGDLVYCIEEKSA
jgi:hypothetical protein